MTDFPCCKLEILFRNPIFPFYSKPCGKRMPVTSASMTVASLTVLSPAAGVRWRDRTPILALWGSSVQSQS